MCRKGVEGRGGWGQRNRRTHLVPPAGAEVLLGIFFRWLEMSDIPILPSSQTCVPGLFACWSWHSSLPVPCGLWAFTRAGSKLAQVKIVKFSLFFSPFYSSPTAYGNSQARGRIGAVAASLHHRHSNTISEPHL